MLIMFSLPCAIHTLRLLQLQPRVPHTATGREDFILSKAKSLIQKPMDKNQGWERKVCPAFTTQAPAAQLPGCQQDRDNDTEVDKINCSVRAFWDH